MKRIALVFGIVFLLIISKCEILKGFSGSAKDFSDQLSCLTEIYSDDSVCISANVIGESRSEETSYYKAEIELKKVLMNIVYNQFKEFLKPNDIWDPENPRFLPDSINHLVLLVLNHGEQPTFDIISRETILKNEIYKTRLLGKVDYIFISERLKEITNSDITIPGNISKNQLLNMAEFYDNQVGEYFRNKLKSTGVVQNPLFYKIAGTFKLESGYAVQLQFREKGLEESQYPFKEEYVPNYSFKQTAWDTLYVLTYPQMKLINKIGLHFPMKEIQEIKAVENIRNKLFFIRYAKGFEIFSENTNEVIFYNSEADVATIAPNGEKVSYVVHKPFATAQDGMGLNCIVDYNLITSEEIEYNRLQTYPIDNWNDEMGYYTREQEAGFEERYKSLVYNLENKLVSIQNNGKILISDVKPVKLVNPYENNFRVLSCSFDRNNDLLAILSENNKEEVYNHSYSIVNIKTGEFLVKDKAIDKLESSELVISKTETGLMKDIHFQLQEDYEKDSTELVSLLADIPNDFLLDSYPFDKKESLLVFAEHNGIVKMDLSNKTFCQFAYPYVLEWYGNSGSVNPVLDYKAIYITSENKILTIQNNGSAILWDVSCPEK